MPEFILDSGGIVLGTPKPWAGGGVKADGAWTWNGLDPFTQGYIEALFFTENQPGISRDKAKGAKWESDVKEGRVKEIPGDYGFADLAPKTLERIIEDCRKFQTDARTPLMANVGERAWQGSTYEIVAAPAGRDFWYTRNGHGCGFWDGDWPEPYATRLSDIAAKAGTVDAYLGDDGKVYLS